MSGQRLAARAVVTYTSPPYAVLHDDGYYNFWRVLNNIPTQMSLNAPDIDDIREGPELSPDGTKIVYQNHPDAGQMEVFVMDSDGGNITHIDGNESIDEFAQYPSWSPDSSKVIYVWNDDGGNRGGEIRTANPDGTGITTIWTPPADAAARRPRYSFNGSKIAFLVGDDGIGGGGTYANKELWTADDDGTNDSAIVTLINDDLTQCQFGWANHSNVLAYYEGDVGGTIGEVMRINADGTGSLDLSQDGGVAFKTISDLAWSSSDAFVFYTQYESGALGLAFYIHRAEADGSGSALIAPTHAAGSLNNTLHSVWVYRNRLWFFASVGVPRLLLSSVSVSGTGYLVGHDVSTSPTLTQFFDETGFENR